MSRLRWVYLYHVRVSSGEHEAHFARTTITTHAPRKKSSVRSRCCRLFSIYIGELSASNSTAGGSGFPLGPNSLTLSVQFVEPFASWVLGS